MAHYNFHSGTATAIVLLNDFLYLSYKGGNLPNGGFAYWNLTQSSRTPTLEIFAETAGICKRDSTSLYVFTTNSTFIYNVATRVFSPFISASSTFGTFVACAADSQANLFLADSAKGYIFKFSAAGVLTATFGHGVRPKTVDPYDPLQFEGLNALAVSANDSLLLVAERVCFEKVYIWCCCISQTFSVCCTSATCCVKCHHWRIYPRYLWYVIIEYSTFILIK